MKVFLDSITLICGNANRASAVEMQLASSADEEEEAKRVKAR